MVALLEEVWMKQRWKPSCKRKYLEPFQIRFDGPPGFVKPRYAGVEDLMGNSIPKGRWEKDGDTDYWLLIFDGKD